MSKADMMFEKLGYEKEDLKDKFDRIWGIAYKNKKHWIEISIDYEDAEICVGTINITDKDSEPVYIGMQVIQAINEKCKELRMDGGIDYGYSKIYGFKRLDYTRNSTCYSKYSICHLLCNKEKVKELRMDGGIVYERNKI